MINVGDRIVLVRSKMANYAIGTKGVLESISGKKYDFYTVKLADGRRLPFVSEELEKVAEEADNTSDDGGNLGDYFEKKYVSGIDNEGADSLMQKLDHIIALAAEAEKIIKEAIDAEGISVRHSEEMQGGGEESAPGAETENP